MDHKIIKQEQQGNNLVVWCSCGKRYVQRPNSPRTARRKMQYHRHTLRERQVI